MNLKDNFILITGGSSGIGASFAERLINLGNSVLICGRRDDKLKEMKERFQAIQTIKCDISKKDDLLKLQSYVHSNFASINILINNAGIQKMIDLKKGLEALNDIDDEINVNFRAQVYVTELFLPTLLKQKNSAIVNVTSGLGFIPMAMAPVYSATKAAMHSFTLSLRHQLKDTAIKVFEVIPPAVHDTYLKGHFIQKSEFSISTSEMTDSFIDGLKNDVYEIMAGTSKRWAVYQKLRRSVIFLKASIIES